jgi:hypothetical protein
MVQPQVTKASQGEMAEAAEMDYAVLRVFAGHVAIMAMGERQGPLGCRGPRSSSSS